MIWAIPARRSIPAWAGEPPLGLSVSGRPRSIPAWAGEPASHPSLSVVIAVYPRVGGGTACAARFIQPNAGLSPRGRGNLVIRLSRDADIGSIPAWAGEPPRLSPRPAMHGVYPRVGGGTRPATAGPEDSWGLSPRGRGNRSVAVPVSVREWSIPAWAGEPSSNVDPRNTSSVYPRVGGGTPIDLTHVVEETGLSPRGRGNLGKSTQFRVGVGSIPAWAGEPQRKEQWSG